MVAILQGILDAIDRGLRDLQLRDIRFFNLLECSNALLVDRIDALREALQKTRQHYPLVIDAVVVLADHIHAIWTLPPPDADFSLRWRRGGHRTGFLKNIKRDEESPWT
jgi:REP element-mobilizing transposase RayT